jgi:hypothetical protein
MTTVLFQVMRFGVFAKAIRKSMLLQTMKSKCAPSSFVAVNAGDGAFNGCYKRFVQTMKLECLRKLILFGNRHLDDIVSGFTHYYNTARCHMERNHLPPGRDVPDEIVTLSRNRVVVESYVSGLFKSFERRAA